MSSHSRMVRIPSGLAHMPAEQTFPADCQWAKTTAIDEGHSVRLGRFVKWLEMTPKEYKNRWGKSRSEVQNSCMEAFFFMAWLRRVTHVIRSVRWWRVRRS